MILKRLTGQVVRMYLKQLNKLKQRYIDETGGVMNIVKHSNGLYEDSGLHHHYFYKVVGNSVHRYSKTLGKWILCLDDTVNKQIKQLES